MLIHNKAQSPPILPVHSSLHGQTKEMIVYYKKRRTEHAPILIDSAVVEQVESFKFLGVHITNKLSWSKHTKTVVKRVQQNLFPLSRLKRFGMVPQIFKKVLQLHHREHYCLVCQLLCLRLQGTTEGSAYGPVVEDSRHPSHRLFSLLTHGKLYQTAKSRFKRLLNSFFPQVIILLNSSSNGYPDFLHCFPPSFTLLLLFVYYLCIVTLTLPTVEGILNSFVLFPNQN
jgi:hypothetical protein